MAGVDIVHVPFREANCGAQRGGFRRHRQMMFSIASTAQSQISGGTVRGIAVTSLAGRRRWCPALPPIAQSGLPGFEVIGWNGFVAPQGTPAPVVGEARRRARGRPRRCRVAPASSRPRATSRHSKNTPHQFGAFIAADTAKWLDLVAKTNMKAN